MSEIDLPDGTYTAVVDTIEDGYATAVVDTIEDGYATVFFERDGHEVGNAILDPSHLPAGACHADAIIDVTIRDETIETATYNPEQTRTRQDSAQERFDRLSERPPSDDEK